MTAARAGARIACITAALDVAAACHPPQRVDETHCAGRQKQLLESVEDARARIVLCVGREDALVIREAATRAERRDPAALRRGA
ncbi:hypothetical protein [Microbacterium sp. Kw_RZR3]|uniref:hypothetical protein n=1 Tax=unclassified Microbacterium TaxID=2609290 RepID=UPI0023DB602A|nr:hypothetical protein [Microbacterium sp. Kw_RZR3]MDF2045494.1 hypothetical protein [Microbacterium sp. Kw_RZR3]